MKNKACSFYTGVFLISALVMSLQILQSRLLSVTSWYHLSFLVISIAMFGLTLGALKIYKGNEEEQRRNYGLIAKKHSMGFGFFIIIALITQLFIPIFSTDTLSTFITLPFSAIATGIAYYNAGIAITVSLTRAPFPIGRTYGYDLIGAGLGCIAALVLMETIDTPSAIMFISGLAFASALAFPVPNQGDDAEQIKGQNSRLKVIAICAIFVTFLTGALNTTLPSPFLYPVWVKNKLIKMDAIDYEGWNSISRVTVMNEEERPPFAWGPSPKFPKDKKYLTKKLVIDGDADTPITKFDGDFSKHEYLEYDVTNIAYNLPDIKKAAIIGVGGGRDLLSAKYYGVDEVTALDVNPVQIRLLRDNPEYREYSNLYNQPGVEILNEEARSWFRKNKEKQDLIQMSLIDTWAATGAGAFALSENGLYTTEAWTIFMDDLSDHGVFTLSRWSGNAQDDSARALSVAMATLFNQGIKDAKSHIAIFTSEYISTLVISKSPFTQEQLDALNKAAAEKEFKIVLIPDREDSSDNILNKLINAKNLEEIKEISSHQFFDISPTTDMRPFFFNQAKLTMPLEIIKLGMENTGVSYVGLGQVKATFNLYIIIIFSALMVNLVIILPMLGTVKNKTSPFILSGTLYFMLIGLGFMFMEISLLQALGVFLGHPIYGLSVVLFSLIISAGIGSFLSEKIPLNSLPRQISWSALTFGYGVAMSIALPVIFHDFAEVSIIHRILISISIMAPAGLLMGFGFPTGLRLTEAFDARATSWFWAINGATGVLGSSLAIAFNIAIGIDKTLVIAGLCYALLSIPFVVLHQCARKKANG